MALADEIAIDGRIGHASIVGHARDFPTVLVGGYCLSSSPQMRPAAPDPQAVPLLVHPADDGVRNPNLSTRARRDENHEHRLSDAAKQTTGVEYVSPATAVGWRPRDG